MLRHPATGFGALCGVRNGSAEGHPPALQRLPQAAADGAFAVSGPMQSVLVAFDAREPAEVAQLVEGHVEEGR